MGKCNCRYWVSLIVASHSSGDLYGDIYFAVSKPVIGYTEDNGGRKWHALFIAITRDKKYAWFDIDPTTGNVLNRGIFTKSGVDESLPVDKAGLDPEEWEDHYPSRILSAMPSDLSKPALTDVYVYLSNGSLFTWNVTNKGTPIWKVTFHTKTGEPAPPLTDFDVAYNSNKQTLFAMTVPLSFNNEKHSTAALICFNLTTFLNNADIQKNPYELIDPAGQAGDVAVNDSGLMTIQLQYSNGVTPGYGSSLLASPVFLLNRLYQALYMDEVSANGNKTLLLQRLYAINLDGGFWTGRKEQFDEGDLTEVDGDGNLVNDYLDLSTTEGKALVIDSKGNLYLLDAEGNNLLGEPIPTGLTYGEEGGGGTATTLNDMKIVYWKKR